jgi:hypothetical protein
LIIDEKDQLVRSALDVAPLRETWRAKERFRMFGELVWDARKHRYADSLEFVEEVLRLLASVVEKTDIGRDVRGWSGFERVGGQEPLAATHSNPPIHMAPLNSNTPSP